MALRYAERRWFVFPLVVNSKRPAVPAHRAADCDGSDPACRDGHVGWEERATTDPELIRLVWSSGRHGLAIATGPSRLLVVDIDVDKATGDLVGRRSIGELEDRVGARLPSTFTVATPSGGEHRYYRLLGRHGGVATSSAGRLGPGVDTRGRGGYVVAAPTVIAGAGRYRIVGQRAVVAAPDWLVGELTSPRTHSVPSRADGQGHAGAGPGGDEMVVEVHHPEAYVRAAVDGEIGRIVSAPISTRNDTLFRSSVSLGRLVGAGLLDEAVAFEALQEAARNQVEVPGDGYGPSQARATIDSGLGWGRDHPRPLRVTQGRIRRSGPRGSRQER